MHETDDILRTTGLLTLGSRFRRLGERLQAETQEILSEIDPRVISAWHPLLNLLDRRGPLAVGQISAALGVTQPGVTRSVTALADLGLVCATPSEADRRVRVVALSEAGAGFVARARAEVWPRVERAVADLCAGFGPELLDRLSLIEDRLDERPLRQRTGGLD